MRFQVSPYSRISFQQKKESSIFHQLAASFNEKIDFGPNPIGFKFVKFEGDLVRGLRLRELPDFCAEHILN